MLAGNWDNFGTHCKVRLLVKTLLAIDVAARSFIVTALILEERCELCLRWRTAVNACFWLAFADHDALVLLQEQVRL